MRPVPVLILLALFFLITHPTLAVCGARDGLILWGNVVVPTLLPFMICSGAAAALGAATLITRPFSPLLNGLLRLTLDGGFVFFTGIFCGCPMGAKTDREFLESRRISPAQARYLLAIANHPSPMFLLGYTKSQLAPCFPSGNVPVLLLLLGVYLPILPLAALAAKVYGFDKSREHFPEKGNSKAGFSLDEHLTSCALTMIRIGCYLMIFSIFSAALSLLPDFLQTFRPILLGFLEITTGIASIAQSYEGLPALILVGASISFGGVCALFQTRSVLTPQTGKESSAIGTLSIRHYLFWKMLHCALTCLVLAVLSQCCY